MAKTIHTDHYAIEIGPIVESSFGELLRTTYANARKIILVDDNTHDACLEYLLTSYNELKDAEIMLLPEGEQNKVMEVCFQVWEAWTEYAIERSDLVINLGGGVVTDMGGFIAAVYKRGLNFINIPTSLMAMVDASIGGKTGIDLGKHKNQLGAFADPVAVYVDPSFLNSLPIDEIRNGFAEMLKHGLIADEKYWGILRCIVPEEDIFGEKIIAESIRIKMDIVAADPQEKEERKKLNFGHTIGHAIEGHFLEDTPIAHGHAVAIGMLAESYISFRRNLISKEQLEEISQTILQHFEVPVFETHITPELFALMLNDKKNFNLQIQCTLLNGIGGSLVNQAISEEELAQAMTYITQFTKAY